MPKPQVSRNHERLTFEKEALTSSVPRVYFYPNVPLGGRLTVGLQTLDLRIGVRIPASQPFLDKGKRVMSEKHFSKGESDEDAN